MSQSDKQRQYSDRIEAAGHKINRHDVMRAWHVHPNGTSEVPDPRGHDRPRHMWLENGNTRSGYQHVTSKHRQDYENRGIPTAQQPERIPELMEASTTVGRHIGFGSKRYDRPVMAVYMKDEERVMRNAMTVGTNGYVVGMNPIGPENIRRRPDDPREVSDRTMADLYYYPPRTPHRRRSFEGQPSPPYPSQPYPPQTYTPQPYPTQPYPPPSHPFQPYAPRPYPSQPDPSHPTYNSNTRW